MIIATTGLLPPGNTELPGGCEMVAMSNAAAEAGASHPQRHFIPTMSPPFPGGLRSVRLWKTCCSTFRDGGRIAQERITVSNSFGSFIMISFQGISDLFNPIPVAA